MKGTIRREGDVVLVYYQDQPTVFARIEFIEPDVKKDWYQLHLTLLTIPPQSMTWILRPSYINGAPFTMGGKSMRLEEVKRPAKMANPVGDQRDAEKPAKVIPIKKS